MSTPDHQPPDDGAPTGRPPRRPRPPQRRRTPDADVPPALLLVDKAPGMTSHDVVARARRVLSVRKVGHAGTLDPMATGLLVLGVGAATRLLGHLSGHDKTYEATIRLGRSTVTDDREGDVLAEASTAEVTEDAVRAALAGQVGALQQVPSSVSAVKVDGRRSYDRVRAGEEFELAPRSVTVHGIDVHRLGRPTPALLDVDVTVRCSTGTYIRAIARDVGAALGVGGHLTALRRTRSGPFSTDQAAEVEVAGAALAAGGGHGVLGLTEAATSVFPARMVTAEQAQALVHGQRVPATGAPGLHAAVGPDGRLVALVEDAGPRAKVTVGFPAG
ncbi:tRNA pseudouridine(55) synthase TruB [Modestobacter sp. I12A-02628]|uniref:tRNA pseudouridine synthase B n=1 Tax=Goekera deserti TaxID=2497753 RepID=A0A7K3WH53_9ACTN|nr:tRNA pseudouridine(55) synthase TruB [Goekera deserti]MPQ97227.1 tRNA pseudouridine(55) synthase TruB [Goekera deserti]NDI50263.1 tRNA pseudouridine(55) synthase TruB [Goekera deserti]NEL55831.1 tRNA pseudouridine(55) synthase TruB [Goekera deserti]